MFRVLQRNLTQHIRTRKVAKIHVNVCIALQCQNPHLKSISNISESKNPSSITVDYLINSCGLRPETALSASKKVRLTSTEKPDSVLTFFQNHGLTKTQITELVSKRPEFLLTDPDKILKPKIEFFHNLGVSGPNLTELLTANPHILTRSLENHFIPSFNFLKSIVSTNDNILNAYKRSTWMFLLNLEKVMGPNIAISRDYGVPERTISKFVTTQPRVLLMNTDRFRETVEAVKKMGFDSSSPMFFYAVKANIGISKSNWKAKSAVYQRSGFSEDEILSMFKRYPMCFLKSEKKIQSVVEFFVKKLTWSPADISMYPHLFSLSLEKRIVPRCVVLKILNLKGVIRWKLKAASVFTVSDKDFLDKFVANYQETIPEVVKAYKGGVEFSGF